MLKYLIAFLSFLPLSAVDYKPEECEEKLYAVHATNFLPTGGILRAGFSRNPFKDPLAHLLYPDVRATVHFALGEMVRPIQVGDQIYAWEESRYAVVLPLKTLLPQVINLNCYDVFTLGSVSIDHEHTTLVIPEDQLTALPTQHRYAVWTYDPKVMKVREAIESVIENKGGWHVRMIPNHSEDILSPAYIEGTEIDINHHGFFSAYQMSHPHVSLAGLRWKPFNGEGYLFGQLELKTLPVVKSLLSATFELDHSVPFFSSEELEDQLREMKETAEKVDLFVMNSPYAPFAKAEYEEKRRALESWMNIVTVEIELNEEGKTLRGASKEQWAELESARYSLTTLRSQVNQLKADLPDYQLRGSVAA